MNVDITIDEKSLDAIVTFKLADFKGTKSFKDALAIVMMIAGDFSLDPEMEVEDLEEIVEKGNNDEASKLIFFINEDEIEAELAK
jgi:hypothetical protein